MADFNWFLVSFGGEKYQTCIKGTQYGCGNACLAMMHRFIKKNKYENAASMPHYDEILKDPMGGLETWSLGAYMKKYISSNSKIYTTYHKQFGKIKQSLDAASKDTPVLLVVAGHYLLCVGTIRRTGDVIILEPNQGSAKAAGISKPNENTLYLSIPPTHGANIQGIITT